MVNGRGSRSAHCRSSVLFPEPAGATEQHHRRVGGPREQPDQPLAHDGRGPAGGEATGRECCGRGASARSLIAGRASSTSAVAGKGAASHLPGEAGITATGGMRPPPRLRRRTPRASEARREHVPRQCQGGGVCPSTGNRVSVAVISVQPNAALAHGSACAGAVRRAASEGRSVAPAQCELELALVALRDVRQVHHRRDDLARHEPVVVVQWVLAAASHASLRGVREGQRRGATLPARMLCIGQGTVMARPYARAVAAISSPSGDGLGDPVGGWLSA